MQEVKAGKYELMIYSDIEEMPAWRYNKFNKYALIDAHIGGSIEDVDKRFGNLYLLAKHEENGKLKNEINNLRQAIYFVLTETNPTMLSFCVLVHSINGEEMKDFSEDGVRRIADRLKEIPLKVVRETTDDVKKK